MFCRIRGKNAANGPVFQPSGGQDLQQETEHTDVQVSSSLGSCQFPARSPVVLRIVSVSFMEELCFCFQNVLIGEMNFLT